MIETLNILAWDVRSIRYFEPTTDNREPGVWVSMSDRNIIPTLPCLS